MEKKGEKKQGDASVCEEQERERILFPQTFLGCSSVIYPCIEGRDDKNPTKKNKIKSETERWRISSLVFKGVLATTQNYERKEDVVALRCGNSLERGHFRFTRINKEND